MRRRQRVFLTAALLGCLLLSGCWSRKELQELSFVTAIGVDWLDEEEQWELTVQIARLAFVPRPGERTGGSPQDRPFHFTMVRGKSTAEALTVLRRLQGRRLYFAHLQAAVFGESAARYGIADTVGFLWRHSEIRPYLDLVVTRGSARELLAGVSPQGENPGRWMVGILEQGRSHSVARSVSLADAMYALVTPGRATALPLMSLLASGTPDPNTAPSFQQFSLDGLCIFNLGRLATCLTPQESRGVILAVGRAREALVSAPLGAKGEQMSVVIRRARSNIEVGAPGRSGPPPMTVRIVAKGELVQRQQIPTPVTTTEIGLIERAIAAQLRSDVEKGIAATQEAGSDVIGFAEALRRENPSLWHQVSRGWDRRYRDLPVTVKVDFSLIRTGVLR